MQQPAARASTHSADPTAPSAPTTAACGDLDPDLECLAGSYASEAEARAAMQALQATPGLVLDQLGLLQPGDAHWWRFRWAARGWLQGTPASQRSRRIQTGLLFGLGIVGSAIGAALIGWLFDDNDELGWSGLALIWLGLTAACAVMLMLRAIRRPRSYRRFDRALRRQLDAGRWAVVAHHVPRAQQSAALLIVRSGSVAWMTVKPPQSIL